MFPIEATGEGGTDERRRVSKTSLRLRLGEPPSATFDRLVESGLIEPPGADGRWPETVLERADAVQALAKAVRSYERRLLRLSLDGLPFTPEAKRSAVISVLERIRPAARKMRFVRQELYELSVQAALGTPPRRPRSFGMPLAHTQWIEAVRGAAEDVFLAHFETAGRYTLLLPQLLESWGRVHPAPIPDEERLVLILVNLLVREPSVRSGIGLPPLRPTLF